MGLIDVIGKLLGVRGPQDYTTDRVKKKPVLEDPRATFRNSVRSSLEQAPITGRIGQGFAAPTINRVQNEINLSNEEQKLHIIKRARQNPDPVKRLKLLKLAQTIQDPNVLQEAAPQVADPNYYRNVGKDLLNVGSFAIPAIGIPGRIAQANPLVRLAGSGAIRGLENTAFEGGKQLIDRKFDPKALLNAGLWGAGANTVLSPKLVGKAGKQVVGDIKKSFTIDPVTGKLHAKPGFAKVPGGEQTPEEARKAFEATWKKAHGNRPQTEVTETALDRANKARKPELTLTTEEARKFARMSEKELADYNAGIKSDPLEALKNEARKYKSAEEFVDRKTNELFDELDKIEKRQAELNAINLLDESKARRIKISTELDNLAKRTDRLNRDYDKSQLTDLYNEATKASSPSTKIAPEAQNQLPREQLTGAQLSTPEKQLRVPTPETPSNPPSTGSSFEQIVSHSGGTDVKKKIGLLDFIRTPDRVMKKIGLEKEALELRRGWDNYTKELPEHIKKIDDWKSQVSPEGNVKIFKFLDGQIGQEALTPNEVKVASEIRPYLEEWADRLGIPKDKRITNYITRIFDQDLVKKEFPDEIANLIQDKVAGSVYDPFTTQRLGKLGYKEDTFAALEAYVKRGARKANMDPALEMTKKASEGLEQSQFNYVKQYIDRINLRPTNIDNLVDNTIKQVFGYRFGARPTANITRKARQVVYRAMLGLNVSSALKNLSQGANTYSELGERFTFKGYTDLFKSIANKSTELEDVGVLRDDFIQDRLLSTSKKALQKADKGLFSLFEFAERVNRGAAYYGAKARALSQGKTEEEAIEIGKDLVRKTQFTFGSVDTPPVLQSDIGKTIGQFQSFTLKQGEFLTEKILAKDIAGLTRWTAASLAFVYGVGQMFGMEPKDLIPSLRIGVPPAAKLPYDLTKLAMGGKDKYGNDLTLGGVLKSDLPGVIPAGIQLKKTYEGLKAANQGYSETDSGKVRFPVNQSTPSKIQAGLFGQYSGEAAREYFQNNRSPLGEKQTEEFKKAPDKLKFYNDIIKKREEKQAGTTAKKGKFAETGEYKLTGNPTVDREVAKKLRSEITKEINDLVQMGVEGLVPLEDIEREILLLQTRYDELGKLTKKPTTKKSGGRSSSRKVKIKTAGLKAPARIPKIAIRKFSTPAKPKLGNVRVKVAGLKAPKKSSGRGLQAVSGRKIKIKK